MVAHHWGYNVSMPIRVFTITVSDSRTPETDTSGGKLKEGVAKAGFKLVRHVIVKDEVIHLQELVRSISTENIADAVLISGGTGVSPRDVTPEALLGIFDKTIDGFGEEFRRKSFEAIGPRAMLSRATAGIVDGLVVFSLPGSSKAVVLGLEIILPVLEHTCEMAIGRRISHG